MSSLECFPPEARNGPTAEAPDPIKRKVFVKGRWICPRRYIIALMLFFLPLLKYWSMLNIDHMIISAYDLKDGDGVDDDIVLGHWSRDKLQYFFTAFAVVASLSQIPGALFIFKFTSYKFLLLSTVATSILHMLMPVVLRHHSITFVLVLLTQEALEAPVYIAIISMWKDWAPPLERTKLMIFSVFGIFVGYGAGRVLSNYLPVIVSRFYLLGVVRLVWALFWYNIISDTPQNDPLISESELLYLECSIPPEDQQKRSLKDVPWKSIITSKPIAILGEIFLKMSVSRFAVLMGTGSDDKLDFKLPAFLGFIFFIISSAILADFLIKKFSGRTLLIRRYFLCGGSILQVCFMCGVFASSLIVKRIFYVLAYMMYAASFPGFFTLALDLSPRYVAILSGIVFTLFSVGNLCMDTVQRYSPLFRSPLKYGVVICDCIPALICSGLFYKWGEVEEQLWSLAPTSPGRKPKCSGLFPKMELQEDVNLAPANV